MGFVYQRGGVLWLRFRNVRGELVSLSTGYDGKVPLRPFQRAEARALLAKLERQMAAGREIMQRAGTAPMSGPLTVDVYAEKWLSQRTNATAKDDAARLRLHVLPRLGQMIIDDVRPRHVRDLVRALKTGPLAGKTVRNVFGTMHRMFGDAVVDEVISSTPCVLARGELPPVEADSSWREGAVYSPEEARALISDPRIDHLHRVVYGLLFYTGGRVGEIAARRWADLKPAEPLHRLEMATAYKTKIKTEGGTKTGVKRATPVHPELAELLEEWRIIGWRLTFGRTARPDDRIVPSATGGFLRDNVALRWLHADCARLGLRAGRRTHDTRRTFISMAEAGGAQTAHIQWVTHGPRRGSVMGKYTTLPWSALCAVVMAVRLPPLVSPADTLRAVSQMKGGNHPVAPEGTHQALCAAGGPSTPGADCDAPGRSSRGLSPTSDSGLASGGISWHQKAGNPAELVAVCYQVAPKDAGSIPAASTSLDAPKVAELGSISQSPESLSPALSLRVATASEFSAPLEPSPGRLQHRAGDRRTRPDVADHCADPAQADDPEHVGASRVALPLAGDSAAYRAPRHLLRRARFLRRPRFAATADAVRVVRRVGEWLAGGAA